MRIVIAGLRKSGTTALFFKIKNSFPGEIAAFFEPQKNTKEFEKKDVVAKVLIDNFRIYEIDQNIFNSFDKKILIVRDPRDQIISSFLYDIRHTEIYKDDKKLEILVDTLKRKEQNPESISVIDLYELLYFLEGKKFDLEEFFSERKYFLQLGIDFHLKHNDYLVFKYEDFINENLKSLEEYLGFPMAGSDIIDHHLDRIKRTKSYGDWKNWFTDRDIEEFKKVFRPYMERYGYNDIWEANHDKKINPEHSHLYVRLIARQRIIEDANHQKDLHYAEIISKKGEYIEKLENKASLDRIVLHEKENKIFDLLNEIKKKDAEISKNLLQIKERDEKIKERDEKIKENNIKNQENEALILELENNLIKVKKDLVDIKEGEIALLKQQNQDKLNYIKTTKDKEIASIKIVKDKEIGQLKNNLFHEKEYRIAIERSLTFRALRMYQKFIDIILKEGTLIRKYYDRFIRFNQFLINGDRKEIAKDIKIDKELILEKNKNPEILFVNHEESRTGAPRIIFDIAKACKIKYKIALLSKQMGSMHKDFAETFDNIIYPLEVYNILARFEKANKILEKIKPKLVYVNSLVSYEYALEAKKMGLPVIFHVHELGSAFNKIMSYEDRLNFGQFADVFIAASKEVYDYLVGEIKCDRKKVVIFHEFIDSNRVTNLAKEGKMENIRNKGEILLVGCGTFCQRKGPDILYEALKILKKRGKTCSAVWIGENVRQFQEYANRIINEGLGVFTFLGEKINPFPYINQADAFVMPSREDPFPLVVLESMALGKPVITFSDNIGSKEAVDSKCGMVIKKTSPEDLADAIEKFSNNLNEFSENAKIFGPEKIKNEYDINIILPKILDLIKSFATNREPLYVFLHMPKCAGSTFLMHASKLMQKQNWLWLFKGKEFNSNNFATNSDINKAVEKLSDYERDKIKLVAGHHVFYGIHKFFNREARYFTFLRNPVERTISHYNFCRTAENDIPKRAATPNVIDDLGNVIEFEKWFLDNEVLHNYMCKFILEEFLRRPTNEITENDFEDIKKVLKEFYFVGTTNDYDTDAPKLYEKLGMKNLYQSDNVSKKYVEINQKFKELIKSRCSFDERLYQFVLDNKKTFEKNLVQ